VGRVGALAGPGREQAAVLAGFQHPVQEELLGPAGRLAAAELGEDGEIEAGIIELESEGVFPVDAAADGVGGLAIGEVLGELQDRDPGELPGWQRGLATPGVEVGEVSVAEDGPEPVAESEVGVALGEGGAGDAGGQLGDVRDGRARLCAEFRCWTGLCPASVRSPRPRAWRARPSATCVFVYLIVSEPRHHSRIVMRCTRPAQPAPRT
jgi:hypothetical protein